MLTDEQKAILAIESRWWKHAGAKERYVKDVLGLDPIRYYQLVNALIENPEAVAVAPVVINRLRRIRSHRRRAA